MAEDFDALRTAAYDEYDADIAKLQSNFDAAVQRAEDSLAKGGEYAQTYYDRWMASAQRYSDLMEIEGRILQSSLNIIDIKENSTTTTSTTTIPTGPTGPTGFKFNPDDIPTTKPATTATTSITIINPTPILPPPSPPPPPPVKTAPIDTILYEEDPVPIEIMADILFENIGGQELINIARNDLVNGQRVIYQPIKNLNSIQQEYNPNNILALQNVSPQIFNNYPIKLEDKIPNVGNGPNGSNAYIASNGDLIIEVINLARDEQVEVEITQGGTIYEVEL